MKNPVLVPEIRDLLNKKKYDILKSFLDDHHEKENAEFLEMLNPDEIWKALNLVDDIYSRAEIFGYLDMDTQVAMVSSPPRKNTAELLREMSHDDRADLFQHLDKYVADKLLLLLPPKERSDVINLTSYHEETAGSIMTSDFATLLKDDTVEQAIRKVRQYAPSKETIYYIYVTDEVGKLIGFISLRKLILSKPKKRIEQIMKGDVIFALADDDREHASKLIQEYDLIALPIVNQRERLVGIVTYDDALEVIQEEHTEDLEKLMAISGGVEEKPYLEVPAHTHFRKRVFWVIVLGILAILSGLIIERYQHILESLIILTFYMPLLNSAGGNTGSQSATVVLRAIALNELVPSDIFKIIRKEFVVSTLLSLCLGIITFIRVFFITDVSAIPPDFNIQGIALVVSISLSLQVLWSTIFGAVIPIIAIKLKLDPAVVSSPALTTFVDIGGITIYFTVARLILGI